MAVSKETPKGEPALGYTRSTGSPKGSKRTSNEASHQHAYLNMKNKKEYDRKRAEIAYADFKKRKAVVVSLLGGKCEICSSNRGIFHLHHVVYHPVESDYRRTAKDFWTRLKRLKEAENHPERFELLCSKCHREWEAVLRFIHRIGKAVLLKKILRLKK